MPPGRSGEALAQRLEAVLGRGEVAHFGFLDQWADPIDASAFLECAADRLDHVRGEIEPALREAIEKAGEVRFLPTGLGRIPPA